MAENRKQMRNAKLDAISGISGNDVSQMDVHHGSLMVMHRQYRKSQKCVDK